MNRLPERGPRSEQGWINGLVDNCSNNPAIQPSINPTIRLQP